MQSKMPDCCAAANCNQCTDQSNIAFFRFPLDPERCKQWLDNCRRPDLEKKTPEQLHRLYKLCANHFEPSLICRHSALRTVLKDGAVPTIFDFTSHLNNPQSRNRKRVREPTEEELEAAKKTKDESPPSEVEEEMGENSTMSDLEPLVKEDASVSKAKDTLKLYFKETLAFTGFSISNNANPNAVEPMSSHGEPSRFSPVCAEKIDQKEVLQFSEDLMGDEMRNSLRSARFFSILLQDVANIEGKEQIPVFIRSVTVAGFPQKHLMGFLPCDVDAESLAYMLLSAIRNKWGLRMEHCRGLTYLTTGSICQKMKDLSSRILREFPQVVLAPSDPYAFNMWLIRCMPILSIQKVVNTVEEVATLLRSSLTLWGKVEAKITSLYGHMKGEVDRIKDACQNHWEYGVDAFQTMLDILEPLLCCINEMNANDMDTAEQVARLRPVLMDFSFIITLVVLKNTLCCVSILNPSLKGTISISSTLQYTISNALKLLSKQLQEIAIFHRKWFSDAVCKAKKLGVEITLPETSEGKSKEDIAQCSLEDFYREMLSTQILQYLVEEVKKVFSTEMVRILRWLSLVPSYMADHNFSIRRDKVADANLNNLARPDSFYDELGCWEVKWKHASKRRILPTTVFGTLKIPDIGFYPNVQSLLKVLGTIPCVNAEADVYGQYDMVLDRYNSYLRATPEDKRLCNMAFVFVNQDVHFSVDDMVESFIQKHSDILQLLLMEDNLNKTQLAAFEGSENYVKEEIEETKIMTFEVEEEKMDRDHLKCPETDKESLKAALQAALTVACRTQSKQPTETCVQQGGEMEYVTRSEMKEVLSVCEDVVRQGILCEVGNSFFSLFIDRVVTLGDKDHLPLFLRFVDTFDVMRLELMGFIEADLDCDAMSERLHQIVTKEWNLNLNYCRGQAYLGSGDVSYKLKAFACKIQEKYPLAICTHSSCYSFNTWWSKSIPVPAITRALDTMDEVLLFFGSDPALEKQLDQVIAQGLRESYEKVQELQGKFCLVWLEKHDSYEVFVQMLEPLVVCLGKINNNKPQRWKANIPEQAGRLLGLMRDFDFIVPMVALKNASCFTRELSSGLQKDHFSAASQLCQISGIVATLNRVKTNIKVFHQNWFDEACALAQSLSVQIKVPENAPIPRDGMLKPATYYKDALSVPLVDNLINAVKDHFSDDHKEALNFLSLVPCSVTVSYMFEILKSKPPLYSSDLPDPDNFFTELCCWRVKWKTKVVTVTIPDTIFQTLRLPLMQYFGNINTLLRIMCVLPSTALEHCGETMHHKLFQDYLRETPSKDRSLCLAMLKVGINFNRDLDRMVAECLKVTPKALEGLCLDKESKSLVKHAETNMEGEHHKEGLEAAEMQQSAEEKGDLLLNVVDANGHSGDNRHSLAVVFKQAAQLAKKNCSFSELSQEDQDLLLQDLGMCHWAEGADQCASNIEEKEILGGLVKSIRDTILSEAQESPFFSLITDKVVTVAEKKYLPTFIRYVANCVPKVELLGFLPFDEECDSDTQSKSFEAVLTEDWGLQMNFCRGQAYMRVGTESLCLKTMSLNILERYPQAVNTPSESCGLAYWLVASLPCNLVTRVLEIVEDLLMFFDQSPGLEGELAQAVDILLNTPREALAEIPETCCSRWKKREDFFDILVDTLEGVLSCLDSVSNNASGMWSSTMSVHAGILSQAVREADFVVALVILKNVCTPLRNCSTVFRCGNPADIICEVDKITPIIESLNNALENINVVHAPWFEEATQLATKVASGQVCFPEKCSSYESPEAYYRETLCKPVLSLMMGELKHNFSESHLNALKVLSLLPTCNPQAVVSEFTEKLPIAYRTDLPEPDSAEQDICNWASFWKEKCQEASPPASISETLLHPKSQDHSTVSTLLKIVAVLPSVSMECDLMKTTLNSMKAFQQNCVCKNNKMDIIMLHMHHTAIRALEDVLNKCIDVDPDRRTFLLQVQQKVESLKLESELDIGIVDENNSAVSQEPSGMHSALANPVKEEQVTDEQKSGDSGQRVLSFYSPSVREEILKELWDSQFFSVITEQVTDIEGERYIPVYVRYLDKQDTQCEESVALIPYCEDTTAFADTMETVLSEKWGLNMEFCRGQSVLSTGTVGSHMRSVSAIILQKYPLATRTISSSVSLNVWLARSSPVLGMARSVATMEKMLLWFVNNVELQAMLEDKITLMFPQDDGKGNELKDRLTSDWGKSHDMFEVIAELLETVALILYETARRQKGHSHQNQARVFSSAVCDFEFVFFVIALKNIMGLTKNLSQSLQGKPLDMFSAVKCLPALLASLNEVKSNLIVHHDAWFREARSLAAKLQIRLLQPALEELLSNHYRNTVSMKAVEHSIAEVTALFSDHTLSAVRCLTIVPYVLSKMEADCMEDIGTCIYKDDLPDLSSLASELNAWNSKWKDPIAGYLPTTVLDTLKVSDIRCFCNIETLLRVLVILPFSRKESTFQPGKKSLQAFMQQEKRSLTELHSL
ncbi:hypothetical protein SKAU_G00272120 [Synaphobranchus kaupii]|uniref:THAP-type domain-containing protein n=1 Tax=Synaphobranchus kaupii TaxID=118154 RepID=A0A9Q1F0K2_SYNKA|nr:hypothetical protein SKAU_G00272120 [Synaphobranchus kaupii]